MGQLQHRGRCRYDQHTSQCRNVSSSQEPFLALKTQERGRRRRSWRPHLQIRNLEGVSNLALPRSLCERSHQAAPPFRPPLWARGPCKWTRSRRLLHPPRHKSRDGKETLIPIYFCFSFTSSFGSLEPGFCWYFVWCFRAHGHCIVKCRCTVTTLKSGDQSDGCVTKKRKRRCIMHFSQ